MKAHNTDATEPEDVTAELKNGYVQIKFKGYSHLHSPVMETAFADLSEDGDLSKTPYSMTKQSASITATVKLDSVPDVTAGWAEELIDHAHFKKVMDEAKEKTINLMINDKSLQERSGKMNKHVKMVNRVLQEKGKHIDVSEIKKGDKVRATFVVKPCVIDNKTNFHLVPKKIEKILQTGYEDVEVPTTLISTESPQRQSTEDADEDVDLASSLRLLCLDA